MKYTQILCGRGKTNSKHIQAYNDLNSQWYTMLLQVAHFWNFLYIVFHFYHKRIIILYIILYILHLYNISIKTNYNNISSRQLLMLCRREGLFDCSCWVRGWRLRGWRLRGGGWSYRHSLAETATPTKSGEYWRWKKH